MDEKKVIHAGEFFVENGIITKSQLDDALDLQKDNKDRLLGEILVTQGVLTKEQLIMAMEMYFMVTGSEPGHFDEWLDQDEIDMIKEGMEKRGGSIKVLDKLKSFIQKCLHG